MGYVVCHLAARETTPFASLDAHLFEQVNNWGTVDVVYSAENSGVSKFIYLSSTSVYGATTPHDSLIDENTPTNPKTFYGISKLRGEGHVDRLKAKMSTYILRCG